MSQDHNVPNHLHNFSSNHSFGSDENSVPQTKTLLGMLIGFCIGFLIAGGIVILLRTSTSESDGFRTLLHCLSVFIPAVVLLILTWIVQPNIQNSVISKTSLYACMLVGLGAGSAVLVTSPTRQTIANRILNQNRELMNHRANQLASFHEQTTRYPVGSIDKQMEESQLATFSELTMNMYFEGYRLSESWNTLITSDADFARLKPGTDPNQMENSRNSRARKFGREDRYEYGSNSWVDEFAVYSFSDESHRIDDVKRFAKEIQQLRYVFIIRLRNENPPIFRDAEYVPGFMEFEAFCFDCETDEMLGTFTFSSTNSNIVRYTYGESSSQASEAMGSVVDDLQKNAWLSFWHRLHELNETVKSQYTNQELPFTPESLMEAELAWRMSKTQAAERSQFVAEQLENLDP